MRSIPLQNLTQRLKYPLKLRKHSNQPKITAKMITKFSESIQEALATTQELTCACVFVSNRVDLCDSFWVFELVSVIVKETKRKMSGTRTLCCHVTTATLSFAVLYLVTTCKHNHIQTLYTKCLYSYDYCLLALMHSL